MCKFFIAVIYFVKCIGFNKLDWCARLIQMARLWIEMIYFLNIDLNGHFYDFIWLVTRSEITYSKRRYINKPKHVFACFKMSCKPGFNLKETMITFFAGKTFWLSVLFPLIDKWGIYCKFVFKHLRTATKTHRKECCVCALDYWQVIKWQLQQNIQRKLARVNQTPLFMRKNTNMSVYVSST